jgi:hypothetical protein
MTLAWLRSMTLRCCLALAIAPAWAADAPGCASVGAVRWDAWHGAKGVPGVAVEKTLGPSRWHDRLPVCAQIVAPDSVRIACDSNEQMKLEIDQAADAGLSYFAFVAYAEDDPMSLGLKAYLAAPNRQRVNFALVSEIDKWGGRSLYRPVVERFVRLMREAGYQRTPEGRPLFFLGFIREDDITRRFGGREGTRQAIDEFRRLVRNAGLPNPYIVLMERHVARAAGLARDLGLDAVSAYAVADNSVHRGSYRQLTTLVEQWWADAQAADLPLVPPVMSGWDRRPRILNPLSWERGVYSDEQMLRYYEPPSRAELQAHLSSAMRIADRYRHSAPSRTAIIYAWNEFDEGGWLAPTRGDRSTRLQAVRAAIDENCRSRQAHPDAPRRDTPASQPTR